MSASDEIETRASSRYPYYPKHAEIGDNTDFQHSQFEKLVVSIEIMFELSNIEMTRKFHEEFGTTRDTQ